MADLPYLDDLKLTLVSLGEIDKELTIANRQREILRGKIKAWLTMNNLESFEIIDSNKSLWRLSQSSMTRRSANCDVLKGILSEDDYNRVVSTTTSSTFKCQIVKGTSTGKYTPAPAATTTMISKI